MDCFVTLIVPFPEDDLLIMATDFSHATTPPLTAFFHLTNLGVFLTTGKSMLDAIITNYPEFLSLKLSSPILTGAYRLFLLKS